LTVLLFVGFVLVAARLFVLQILSASFYQAVASGQYNFEKTLQPTRGEIKVIDKDTDHPFTVATTIQKQLVYAVPKDVTDPKRAAEQLAPVLGLDAKDLLEKISGSEKKYVVLKRQLTDEQEQVIKGYNLAGINFDSEPVRFYPEKNFLSHVLGYVGYKDADRVGRYGLEEYFENQLKGVTGEIKQEKDVSGAWIFAGNRDIKPAQDGDTLILTIDRTIQHKAENIIKDTVSKNQADSGSIVVMNPKTGAVLAIANYPDFDPNDYNKVEDPSIFVNRAVMGAYEPGSIFKPLTMAAAINEGKVLPDTTYVDTGVVNIDGYQIQNSDHKAHGKQTMTQVLEASLNTGAIFAKEQIGNAKFLEYVKNFGFGKETGIELRESKGNLDNLKANIAVNFDTASFGQGISVTPLQIVEAYSALANSGSMVKPFIVQAHVASSGKITTTQPEIISRVVSAKTATTLGGMLVNVVENGHGKKAKVPGFWVAGKTGTAQVSRKDGKGYEQDINIGSFIGYAPVDKPQFVALVRVNHPRTVQFAESTAAPAFGELASFILNYYNVQPTRDLESKNK